MARVQSTRRRLPTTPQCANIPQTKCSSEDPGTRRHGFARCAKLVGHEKALSEIKEQWEDKPLKGRDPLTFGKYMGWQYRVVIMMDPSYCRWILKTHDHSLSSCDGLKRFARYIKQKDARRRDPQMRNDPPEQGEL